MRKYNFYDMFLVCMVIDVIGTLFVHKTSSKLLHLMRPKLVWNTLVARSHGRLNNKNFFYKKNAFQRRSNFECIKKK